MAAGDGYSADQLRGIRGQKGWSGKAASEGVVFQIMKEMRERAKWLSGKECSRQRKQPVQRSWGIKKGKKKKVSVWMLVRRVENQRDGAESPAGQGVLRVIGATEEQRRDKILLGFQ